MDQIYLNLVEFETNYKDLEDFIVVNNINKNDIKFVKIGKQCNAKQVVDIFQNLEIIYSTKHD